MLLISFPKYLKKVHCDFCCFLYTLHVYMLYVVWFGLLPSLCKNNTSCIKRPSFYCHYYLSFTPTLIMLYTSTYFWLYRALCFSSSSLRLTTVNPLLYALLLCREMLLRSLHGEKSICPCFPDLSFHIVMSSCLSGMGKRMRPGCQNLPKPSINLLL